METAKTSAKEIGRNFIKSISADNIVIHPPKKHFTASNVVTLDCAIHSVGGPYLFSIQVSNPVLKTAQPFVTQIEEIIPALRKGEVTFAYATIGEKTMLYFPDSYRLYPGGDVPHVTEIYDVHDDILRRIAGARDLLIACYEKNPQMLLLK